MNSRFLECLVFKFDVISVYLKIVVSNTSCDEQHGLWCFGGVRVAHRFRFLYCAFVVVCLRPVSCVSSVASVSRLSILNCPFDFL
jgi:hypothetical protein